MTDADQIENLSQRILAKELVFFVGAGFSIDSEGLSASRLMIRLSLRFKAMIDCLLRLAKTEGHVLEKYEDELARFPDKLKKTFDLKHTCTTAFDCPSRCWDRDIPNQCDFNKLAVEYYAANDWFCATFQRLLQIGSELTSAKIGKLIEDISEQEMKLNPGRKIEKHPSVPVECCMSVSYTHLTLPTKA